MLNTKTLDFSRKNKHVFTVAHRGIWSTAPENSMLAVQAAIDAGAEIVEIDTQRCASGEFVVIHDDTLDRTTTGSGAVAAMNLDDIQSVYLLESDGSSKVSTSERIPLLLDVLELARNRIIVNVDAKHPEQLAEIVDYIESLGLQDQVIVKSKVEGEVSPDVLEISQRVMHIPMVHARKGQLIERLKNLAPLAPKMIELHFDYFEEFAEAQTLLDQLDYRIWLNTLDLVNVLGYCDHQALKSPQQIWGALIETGVGAIQTDQTVVLRECLQKWGK